MYPEPHFPAEELRRAREEIERLGFEADPWLERLDVPVLGLNVAVHWPLPAAFRDEYDRLRARLQKLRAEVHVYPFEQTHVTLATIVSFKRHERPDAQSQRALHGRLPELRRAVDHAAHALGAFEIDVGAPVLVRTAAFLPILNRTGEIAELRRAIAAVLEGDRGLQIPRALHSTVLRFRTPPAAAWAAAFDAVAAQTRFGPALVDEILITTETRPYMMAGEIVHRHQLRLPSSG
jgi:hypothetical protein